MSYEDFKELWKEIGTLRHEILTCNTNIHNLTHIMKAEKEKIASYSRKLNILIETVELAEKGAISE